MKLLQTSLSSAGHWLLLFWSLEFPYKIRPQIWFIPCEPKLAFQKQNDNSCGQWILGTVLGPGFGNKIKYKGPSVTQYKKTEINISLRFDVINFGHKKVPFSL